MVTTISNLEISKALQAINGTKPVLLVMICSGRGKRLALKLLEEYKFLFQSEQAMGLLFMWWKSKLSRCYKTTKCTTAKLLESEGSL
ncbi:hypothetical protein CW304_26090 [Bacillus sp. UFRGS-B20]|nr:hypothetical protein CW304_26090 [Bacillus sp. UFRGS-B20]